MNSDVEFGNYVLEERIASGGMAEVFRARRIGAAGFSRTVCIKRILPALCREESFVNMFVDEARTGSQLRHGNIVAIDDFGQIDGQYFLCMEWVPGMDLWRLSRRITAEGHVFPIDVVLHIGAELLRGLDYAHRKLGADGAPLGIVHRDVSPHNVLLSHAGEAKLSDFGIAKAASRLHHTVGQVIKGKLTYMAPEQARGNVLDGRADLFALGIVLFEALAGRRPYAGLGDAQVVLSLLRGERLDLAQFRPDVPPECIAWVHRMLDADRAHRYSSAGAALDDLTALSSGSDGAKTLASMMSHYTNPEGSTASNASLDLPYSVAPTDPTSPPFEQGDTVAYGPRSDSPILSVRTQVASRKDETHTMARMAVPETPARRQVSLGAVAMLALSVVVAIAVGYAFVR